MLIITKKLINDNKIFCKCLSYIFISNLNYLIIDGFADEERFNIIFYSNGLNGYKMFIAFMYPAGICYNSSPQ
jgi:hypothetical protein